MHLSHLSCFFNKEEEKKKKHEVDDAEEIKKVQWLQVMTSTKL